MSEGTLTFSPPSPFSSLALVNSQLERELRRECPYLIPANAIVQTISFPKKFDDDKVFNDLAFQWFPSNVVPQDENDPFWSSVTSQADPEAPVIS